ncbi:cobalamin biosynthesis protein CobD/CbiB [Catenovulum sediminis]|uniref:Cobalamin biosynthesis protein n=1 Tax=Catenovulum sediminis TaxID=1740262 RepID=A0ABV1RJS1_9ALTE|nr:cobalamin biosynthesis protein [Catenovulum sediminis]
MNWPEIPFFVQQVAVLAAASIAALFWPVDNKYHPVYIYTVIAQRLGAKVNPDPARPATQLIISGTLALSASVIPPILMVWLFYPFVEFPLFLDWLILWLCINYQPCKIAQQKVAAALIKEQKNLARDRLSDWVLRKTDTLSAIGICKASIESLSLHALYGYFAVFFWYLVGGPLAVILLRLLFALQQSWNPKKSDFVVFAKPVSQLLKVLIWFPAKLLMFSLLAPRSFKSMYKAIFNTPRACIALNLISAMADALKVQLAGPVIYQKDKVRRERVGLSTSPQCKDILNCSRLIKESMLIWWIVIVIIVSVIMILPYYFS